MDPDIETSIISDNDDGSISSSWQEKEGGNDAMKQLEDEMKLLRWHKVANESAIQAAIIRTKNLKKKDKVLKAEAESREREMHKAQIRRIIKEEMSKPLKVNKEFAKKYIREKHQATTKRVLTANKMKAKLKESKQKMCEKRTRRSKREMCKRVQADLKQQEKELHRDILTSDKKLLIGRKMIKQQDRRIESKSDLENILHSIDGLSTLERTINGGRPGTLPNLYGNDATTDFETNQVPYN